MKGLLVYAMVMLGVLAASCCGEANLYREFYLPETENVGKFAPAKGEPKAREIKSTDEVKAWLDKGYVLVGTSAFSAPWAPRVQALEFGRKVGAEIVLFHAKFDHVENHTFTEQMPVTYLRNRGGIYQDAAGRPREYIVSQHPHTSVAVTREVTYDYYEHQTYFLAPKAAEKAEK